jgi:hypothetical protein
MRSASLRGKVVVLLLAITLAVPWCAAAAPTSEPPVLLSRLWLFVTSLWGDIGCHLDPNGACSPNTNQGDTGCHIDPDGRCRDAVTVEPPATSNGDTGCHIDPNGGCGG